jgi:hypothetical protein
MVVLDLGTNVIQVKLLTGNKKGSVQFLTNMGLSPSDRRALPDQIQFTRYQFPIKPAFAMTTNRDLKCESQGLTFEKIGMYLQRQVFSHGQAYVAFSRTGSRDGIVVYQPGKEDLYSFANVVYCDVFPRQQQQQQVVVEEVALG